jgi:hypothetical protein
VLCDTGVDDESQELILTAEILESLAAVIDPILKRIRDSTE